ncbi:MAG TPA: YXWGXW repeat-containing protein [Gemmatimonadaceae bacterium]
MPMCRTQLMKLTPLTLALCLTAGACATAAPPRRERVYREQVYVIHRAPPPARVEVVTRSPGHHYVWVEGHYRWDGRDYDWVPGHWERPPHGRHAYQQGYWAHDHRGWYYVEGRWR